jgi:hypothetical protein
MKQPSRTRFGTSDRDPGVSPHRMTPGPDAYSIDGSFSAVKHADPRFSFPHGGRFGKTGVSQSPPFLRVHACLAYVALLLLPPLLSLLQSNGPGPGEYGTPKLPVPEGPAFTMRAR